MSITPVLLAPKQLKPTNYSYWAAETYFLFDTPCGLLSWSIELSPWWKQDPVLPTGWSSQGTILSYLDLLSPRLKNPFNAHSLNIKFFCTSLVIPLVDIFDLIWCCITRFHVRSTEPKPDCCLAFVSVVPPKNAACTHWPQVIEETGFPPRTSSLRLGTLLSCEQISDQTQWPVTRPSVTGSDQWPDHGDSPVQTVAFRGFVRQPVGGPGCLVPRS